MPGIVPNRRRQLIRGSFLDQPAHLRFLRSADLQAEFGTKGMGYAGVDLYAGGKLTAEYMLAQGLKSGDEAMVYGVFSQAERGQSEKGLADTLEAAGLKVDRLEISQEVNSDASLATNVLDDAFDASPALVDNTIYLRGLKNLYAIGQ